jgi:hypothetical protein
MTDLPNEGTNPDAAHSYTQWEQLSPQLQRKIEVDQPLAKIPHVLPANAPDSAIQPAWSKQIETNLEKKHGVSTFVEAIDKEAQEFNHKSSGMMPEMSVHDKQVYSLVAEHDKRIARAHFDLPKDASEAQIFQKMYPAK